MIDWSRFEANVKYSKDNVLGKTTSELMSEYIDIFGFEERQAKEFSKPAVDQPTQEQRDALAALLMVVLEKEDKNLFADSMEGDFCDWWIHTADLVDRGGPLTAGDWFSFHGLFMLDGMAREDVGEACGPDGLERFDAAVERCRELGVDVIAERYKETENLFNTYLC